MKNERSSSFRLGTTIFAAFLHKAIQKAKKLGTLARILGLAIFLLLAACAQEPVARITDLKGKTLIVGGELYAPMFLQNDNGTFSGFDVDILTAICKEINCKLSVQVMPFNDLFDAITTGKIELAISGISITNEREKTMDFTKPYLILNLGTPEEDRIGFPLRSGSELRQAINTGIDLIGSNGIYDAISRKWFPDH